MNSIEAIPRIYKAFEPLRDSDPYMQYSRSVFDMDFVDSVKGLALGDNTLPVLVPHALRSKLAENPNWQTCVDFTEETVTKAIEDPKKYGMEVIDSTRNSWRYDESRKTATGMAVHYTYGDNIDLNASFGYGLLWAYERNDYQGVELDNKIISIFSFRNIFGVYINGDPYDQVQPALVLNSALDNVLISYDITPRLDKYSCAARSMLLSKGEEPSTAIINEHVDIGRNMHMEENIGEVTPDIYKPVAEVSVDSDGRLVVNADDEYYPELFERLQTKA